MASDRGDKQHALDPKPYSADNEVTQMVQRDKGTTEAENEDVTRMTAEIVEALKKPSGKRLEDPSPPANPSVLPPWGG